MTIVHASDKDFNNEVSEGVVLVDFWAPWCGPCKMIAPALEELDKEFANKVKIVKVNVDDNQQVASELGVMSIPALFVYKDGQIVEKEIGFRPKEGILEMLNKHI